MNLKEYQEDAVAELYKKSKKLLEKQDTKRMIFKSPTGSGKTVVVAEFLKKLADDAQVQSFACIWTAPRKLHLQSKDKLEKYYAQSCAFVCSEFNELSDYQIADRQILFLNWESIRQVNNVIIRDNEQGMYLNNILKNTRESERAIILLIDESHYHITEISQELINDIKPTIIIEISATPVLQNPDELVTVDLEDVKAEGMIKKSVLLNNGFQNELSQNSIKPSYAGKADDFVLEQALTKRQELLASYQAAGVSVNPLLCIQLPDRRTQQDDIIKDNVIQFLKEHDITVDNHKLAFYLADRKENLENISRNDNQVEVMIFKQAIALGWDCPRAQLLVLFRNWKNFNFSVQTLGRIMRMPEPEFGHYATEMLNSGYVYTNLSQVMIGDDVTGGYVCIYNSHCIESYTPLRLKSVHRLRQREITRLSPFFINLFLEAAEKCNLKGKINMQDKVVQTEFVTDYEHQNIDQLVGKDIQGELKINVENKEDLQRLFDYFARDNLEPFYPEDRSIGRVKSAIYEFFAKPLLMPYSVHFEEIINLVLSKSNRKHFIKVLTTAKDEYQKKTKARKEPLQPTKYWEVPISITYGENYCEYKETTKSVMQPFYAAKNQSKPEQQFIELLENSEKVKWWYKNGESESKYFAVPYTQNNEEKPFYVDFIVWLADGRIGLFDTKSGFTISESSEKSDGLLTYIQLANKQRKQQKLYGGIVTPVHKNYSGDWKIYQGKGDKLNSKDLSNWKIEEL